MLQGVGACSVPERGGGRWKRAWTVRGGWWVSQRARWTVRGDRFGRSTGAGVLWSGTAVAGVPHGNRSAVSRTVGGEVHLFGGCQIPPPHASLGFGDGEGNLNSLIFTGGGPSAPVDGGTNQHGSSTTARYAHALLDTLCEDHDSAPTARSARTGAGKTSEGRGSGAALRCGIEACTATARAGRPYPVYPGFSPPKSRVTRDSSKKRRSGIQVSGNTEAPGGKPF